MAALLLVSSLLCLVQGGWMVEERNLVIILLRMVFMNLFIFEITFLGANLNWIFK